MNSEDSLNTKIAGNLHEASLWLIKEGMRTYLNNGKNGIHRKLVDDWGGLLWIDPWIEENGILVQFRIKARGVKYQILDAYREYINGYYYDFWVVKIVAESWTSGKNRSYFYVTKANNINGSREIVYGGDQFKEGLNADGIELSIPIDDLSLLYLLEAWEFPENYKNSELLDRVVEMDSEGVIRELK